MNSNVAIQINRNDRNANCINFDFEIDTFRCDQNVGQLITVRCQ